MLIYVSSLDHKYNRWVAYQQILCIKRGTTFYTYKASSFEAGIVRKKQG
jgi:hypothetical protein